MVMADLDVAGEYLLEQGFNGAIPIGPICADEVNACCRENDHGENQTEGPESPFVSPEFRFATRIGRKGRNCRQWRACHGIEVSMKPVVEAVPAFSRISSRRVLGDRKQPGRRVQSHRTGSPSENFVYFLDENRGMDRLVYNNEFMSMFLGFSEQINEGDLPGE